MTGETVPKCPPKLSGGSESQQRDSAGVTFGARELCRRFLESKVMVNYHTSTLLESSEHVFELIRYIFFGGAPP